MLAVCFVAFALVVTVQSKELQIKNQGSRTIWVGFLSYDLPEHGGFRLDRGQQVRAIIITTDDKTVASNPTTTWSTELKPQKIKPTLLLGKISSTCTNTVSHTFSV
jgi:hypothetical protein